MQILRYFLSVYRDDISISLKCIKHAEKEREGIDFLIRLMYTFSHTLRRIPENIEVIIFSTWFAKIQFLFFNFSYVYLQVNFILMIFTSSERKC